jgi:hypothetical protein
MKKRIRERVSKSKGSGLPQVKESFEKGKKVVTFFKSSTIGYTDLVKVQEDLFNREDTHTGRDYLLTHGHIHAYTLSFVSHTDTLDVLLQLPHLIP